MLPFRTFLHMQQAVSATSYIPVIKHIYFYYKIYCNCTLLYLFIFSYIKLQIIFFLEDVKICEMHREDTAGTSFLHHTCIPRYGLYVI